MVSLHTSLKNRNIASYLCFLRRKMCDAREHIEHARQSDAVAPHLVFCRIRMGILEPFANLVVGLGLLRYSHGFSMRFKDLAPKCHLFLGRFIRPKPLAPAVGEALQATALFRSQSADGIHGLIDDGRIFGIPRHKRRRFFALHLRMASRRHGVDGMTIDGVEREAHVFCDAASLRTVFLVAPNQRALDGDHCDAALIGVRCIPARVQASHRIRLIDVLPCISRAFRGESHIHRADNRRTALTTRRIAAAAVERPYGSRCIDSCFRIRRQHGIGLERRYAEESRILHDERLVVAACAIMTNDGRADFERSFVPCIRSMRFKQGGGNSSCAKRRRLFLRIADAVTLRRMLGGKARA